MILMPDFFLIIVKKNEKCKILELGIPNFISHLNFEVRYLPNHITIYNVLQKYIIKFKLILYRILANHRRRTSNKRRNILKKHTDKMYFQA